MVSPATTRGLRALTVAFALSQFFRTCLAVMAPELQRDLLLSPAGFGALSSCFFLAFALAQVPVGVAFDRYGVGAPTRVLLALGVASALLFVLAPNGGTAMLAQLGLGLACAPVFMGLMHHASATLPPQRYVAFLGRSNALGMVGALLATAPLGWAVHAIGWRVPIALAALCMLFACIGVWRQVRDHGHADAKAEAPVAMLGASARLLALPAMWTLIPLCVAMAAGTAFRNAWGGPYLADVFGLQAGARGMALTVLSLGGFCTALLLPWLVRRASLKRCVLGWSLLAFVAAAALAMAPAAGLLPDLALLTVLGTVGMLHPLVMAHGRELVAPAQRGRGLGLLNSFVFLGSALAAWAFGLIADWGQRAQWAPAASYGAIFGCAAVLVLAGLLPYAFSPRPTTADARS
ncbi:MFS transporter [Xenophilus aerolatus]|nr:MFS transporter [Xenophilus aerolatus]